MSKTNPIKISTGFSDKISENYNSKQYSISLEMEAQINGSSAEVEKASATLFALCKKIISQQKSLEQPDSQSPLFPNNEQPPEQQQQVPPQNDKPQQNYSNKPVTEKQIKCIYGVAKQLGKRNKEIEGLASKFSKNKLEDLSSREASQLIESLKHI